jgi:two-component system, OmpR family, KDP operon response regulator KdpE
MDSDKPCTATVFSGRRAIELRREAFDRPTINMHTMSTPPLTVLVIEDNAELRQLIREAFELAGFEASGAKNGVDGLKSAAEHPPALITLDVDLPDMSGSDVLDRLRSSSSVPVIILSGRSTVADKVRLLGLGADDYLVKPFEMDDLLMRSRCAIRSYLRPSAGEPRVSVGSLSIDLGACVACIDEDPLDLTPAEYRLLRVLAERAGNVVTDHRLLKDMGGSFTNPGDLHRLRILVRDLRERIEPHPHRPRVVRELGVGYRLVECCDTATWAVDRSSRIS